MDVCHDEPFEPVHHSGPTFLLRVLYDRLDWAVAIFLLVCQELERIDQVVGNSLRRCVRSKHFRISAVRAALYDQDSVRGLPLVLAAASHALQACLFWHFAVHRSQICADNVFRALLKTFVHLFFLLPSSTSGCFWRCCVCSPSKSDLPLRCVRSASWLVQRCFCGSAWRCRVLFDCWFGEQSSVHFLPPPDGRTPVLYVFCMTAANAVHLSFAVISVLARVKLKFHVMDCLCSQVCLHLLINWRRGFNGVCLGISYLCILSAKNLEVELLLKKTSDV